MPAPKAASTKVEDLLRSAEARLEKYQAQLARASAEKHGLDIKVKEQESIVRALRAAAKDLVPAGRDVALGVG